LGEDSCDEGPVMSSSSSMEEVPESMSSALRSSSPADMNSANCIVEIGEVPSEEAAMGVSGLPPRTPRRPPEAAIGREEMVTVDDEEAFAIESSLHCPDHMQS